MNNRDSAAPRGTLLCLIGLVIISWAIGLIAIPYAPARIVTHWGLDGQPNGYMNRVPGLLFIPVLLTVLLLLFQVLPKIDPQRRNYPAFASSYRYIQLLLAVFLVAVQGLTTTAALGSFSHTIGFWVTLLVSLLFVGLGNILGKLRPNWFAGIRTPWTLSSPEVWTRTHRIGGYLLVLVGLAIFVANFVLPPQLSMVVMLGGLLLWAVVTVFYSYWVWRQLSPQ
ncbi:MAG: SdpI family protein [Herpetosiphonaceae bacterium]|nr:SdpI family protein [Herpetosiphonaceae bacterium]